MEDKQDGIWNYKTTILYYDIFWKKTNMKADILSRKDHIDTTNDNKDIQMLKDEMWTRRQILAEVKMILRN